jgi:hypothetical protein
MFIHQADLSKSGKNDSERIIGIFGNIGAALSVGKETRVYLP